jgi:hypothetical protein
MNILPKTKDHPLKTRKVFGLFLRMSCAAGAEFAKQTFLQTDIFQEEDIF